jgi:hypothetical protein
VFLDDLGASGQLSRSIYGNAVMRQLRGRKFRPDLLAKEGIGEKSGGYGDADQASAELEFRLVDF